MTPNLPTPTSYIASSNPNQPQPNQSNSSFDLPAVLNTVSIILMINFPVSIVFGILSGLLGGASNVRDISGNVILMLGILAALSVVYFFAYRSRQDSFMIRLIAIFVGLILATICFAVSVVFWVFGWFRLG